MKLAMTFAILLLIVGIAVVSGHIKYDFMQSLPDSTTFRITVSNRVQQSPPDSAGTTTFRDSSGRVTITTTPDANGNWIIRDADGRILGMTPSPPQTKTIEDLK